jgi:hypothetical protein
MLQRAASNAYSWWWASHIRTKQSKWLDNHLQGVTFISLYDFVLYNMLITCTSMKNSFYLQISRNKCWIIIIS